jgi:hypothetical protein
MAKKVIRLTEQDVENLVKRIIKEDEGFEWTDNAGRYSVQDLMSKLQEKFPNIQMTIGQEFQSGNLKFGGDLLVTTSINYDEEDEDSYTVHGMVIKSNDRQDEDDPLPYLTGPFHKHYYGGEVNDEDMWFSESGTEESIIDELTKVLGPDGSPYGGKYNEDF